MTTNRAVLFAAVVLAATCGLTVFTQAAAPAAVAATPAPASRPAPAAMPATLGAAMKDMAKAYTAVKAEAADPTKKAQALKDVATMQRDAAISKTLSPPTLTTMPADKKAEAADNYRLMMNQLMARLIELEDAVASGKADDIKKTLGAIDDTMKQGHLEFMPSDN